jgi:hypothetical protein
MADRGIPRLWRVDLQAVLVAKSGGNHPFWEDEPLFRRVRHSREVIVLPSGLFDEHYVCGRSGDLYGLRSGD